MVLTTTHTNALAYIGMARQSVKGTAVAPTTFMRWHQAGPMEDMMKVDTFRGGYTRDLEFAAKTAQFHDGKFTTWLYPSSGGQLLSYFMGGQDVVTGGGPYTHTFHPAGIGVFLPNITFEHSMGINNEVDRVQDCVVDELTLSGKAGGLVTLASAFRGTVVAAQGSPATVTYETTRPATYVDGVITPTGMDIAATDITEVTLTMKNTAEQVFTFGSVYPNTLLPGAREFDVACKVFVPDNKLYREVYFGSAGATTGNAAVSFLTSLEFKFDVSDGGPTRSIDIVVNNIEMDVAKPNYDNNAKAFIVDAHGKAILSNISSTLVTCVAINGDSAAYVP